MYVSGYCSDAPFVRHLPFSGYSLVFLMFLTIPVCFSCFFRGFFVMPVYDVSYVQHATVAYLQCICVKDLS